MTTLPFVLLLPGVVLAYVVNWQAAASLRATAGSLHSTPAYHGLYAALMVSVPVLSLVLLWLLLQGSVIDWMVLSSLPQEATADSGSGERSLILAEIRSLAGGARIR